MGRGNILERDPDGATARQAAARPAATVPGWNEVALRAAGAQRADPQRAARALATVHTSMYNAWAAYDGDARQTVQGVAVRLPRAGRSAASKTAAMSHAAYRILVDRFPDCRRDIDAHMRGLGLDPAGAADPFSPAGIGRTQAAAILDAHRHGGEPDGQHREAPFAPLPLPPLSPPSPTAQDRVARLGRSAIAGREAVAVHWCRLARQVSVRDGHDDDRDVLLFFVLANALADAAMAARDGVSVHAACAAAAAEVLRRFTGSDRLDATLPWATFTAAADETASACARDGGNAAAVAAGQALGRQVGARVFDKARRYWQGKL